MRAAWLMAFVLAGCNCSPPPPPPPACSTPPGFLPAAPVLGVVGRPLSVELALDQTCDVGIMMSAEVTVDDPANQSVVIDQPMRSVEANEQGVRTTVTFTPQLAGPYHVVARFQPNLGIVQADVLVAANRTTETPKYTLASTMLLNCQHVELTAGQLLLCLAPHTEVHASDGGQLQALDGKASAWAEGSLWVLDNQNAVSRWLEGTLEDGGPGLVRSPDVSVGPLQSSSNPPLLLPTGDDIVVLNPDLSLLNRIGVSDGGLSFTGVGNLNGPPMPWLAGWRGGDKVLTVSMGFVCSFSFDAGSDLCPRPGVNDPPFAMDRSGVWQLTMAFDGVTNPQVLSVVNSTASATLPVPSGYSAVTPQALMWETGPVLESSDARYILSAPHGDFALAAFAREGQVVSASATAVTVANGLTLKIYPR